MGYAETEVRLVEDTIGSCAARWWPGLPARMCLLTGKIEQPISLKPASGQR